MTRTPRIPLLLIVAACLLSVGCIQRTISITSEPAGALVYLNDEEVGRTPVVVPFTFYGVYDVRMEAEGYHPLWTQQRAKAPWWETPGIDLMAEAVPRGKAELQWHFTMDEQPPAEEVDADLLLDHAKQLRATTMRAGDSAE
jgi:PEGA domain